MADLRIRQTPIGKLHPNPRNPRRIIEARFEDLKRSLEADPDMLKARPVIARPDGTILAGNMRWRAAEALGWKTIPAVTVDLDDERAKTWLLRDNQSFGEYDEDLLAEMLYELEQTSVDLLPLAGFADDELQRLLDSVRGDLPSTGLASPSMVDRFGAPPFSVLNTESKYWRARKEQWIALGLKGEEGREGAHGSTPLNFGAGGVGRRAFVSLFDPVLCELVYRWFSPPGADILDPFAGGSTRGVVASVLGRSYLGVDLNAEQIAANDAQADDLLASDQRPAYVVADSRLYEFAGESYDLLFSCPPYYDLEQYSTELADLSCMTVAEFDEAYASIIASCVQALRPDRFACFVVANSRGKDGNLRDLVSSTTRAFRAAGMDFYNEAVLVTPVGSLPIRAGRYFLDSRKLGKRHQNILVFVKGDPEKAAEACGELTPGLDFEEHGGDQ